MNPSDYISKAIHAIETDQPNLAMLYMKRGIEESRKRNPNPMIDAKYAILAFARAMEEVNKSIEASVRAMIEAFRPAARWHDYALVADNEG